MTTQPPSSRPNFIDLGTIEIEGKVFTAKLVYKDSLGRIVEDITHIKTSPALTEPKKAAIRAAAQGALEALNTSIAEEPQKLQNRSIIHLSADAVETQAGTHKTTHDLEASIKAIWEDNSKFLSDLYKTTPRAAPPAAAPASAPPAVAPTASAEFAATVTPRTPLEEAQYNLAQGALADREGLINAVFAQVDRSLPAAATTVDKYKAYINAVFDGDELKELFKDEGYRQQIKNIILRKIGGENPELPEREKNQIKTYFRSKQIREDGSLKEGLVGQIINLP